LIHLKSPREIEKMRRAGALLAEVFVEVCGKAQVGVTTLELDSYAEELILKGGASPAFKGYGGPQQPFPATTCISIDDEIVHGIPSANRKLKAGQIVGIDMGLVLDGFFADMACSMLIGKVSDNMRRLWQVTKSALYKGIEQAQTGHRIGHISGAVQDWVEQNDFSVIRDLVGHGIGTRLHEEPSVPNFRSFEGNVQLRSGMTIAIEPMVAAGGWKIKTLSDGWTSVTADHSPAAHFEHTVLVTDDGGRILTLLEDGRDPWSVVDSFGKG